MIDGKSLIAQSKIISALLHKNKSTLFLAHQSENIEVDDLMRRYSNDVIASAGFGLKINSLEDRDNEFYQIGCKIFDFDVKQRIVFVLSTMWPDLPKVRILKILYIYLGTTYIWPPDPKLSRTLLW